MLFRELALLDRLAHFGDVRFLTSPFLILFSGVVICGLSFAAKVPSGFKTETIAEGVNAGTALAISPDGTVYLAEQTGHIRIVRDGALLDTPLLDLSARMDTHWERGLIGLQLHPDYPKEPYLFVVYVTKEPFTHHVISRFAINGDKAPLNSEKVLFEGDDQAGLGGSQPGGHQGGPIRFGLDGCMYIGIGEQTEQRASQSMDTLQGKILRLNIDGSIPEDNPFYNSAEGKYRAIYALGIRNPFGLAFKPGTNRLFEAEVGKSSFDEINEIKAGKNYGWPLAEGFSEDPALENPIHAYPPAIGRSICGSVFYPQAGNFPDEWKGKFFIADWGANWVKAIDLDDSEKLIDFGAGFNRPVALEVAPDGALWVLNRGTRWRDNKQFLNNSSFLTRISYVGGDYVEGEDVRFPQTLDEAGAWNAATPYAPGDGFVPFELNAPAWKPGVRSRYWIKMPSQGKVVFSAGEDWVFPESAILVQHFESQSGQAHETHLYRSNGDGSYQATAYSWSATSDVPTLVAQSAFKPMASDETVMWLSPGPTDALDPKTAIFGFQPQFNARQLNVGDQLADWQRRGWLAKRDLKDLPQLSSLDDPGASKLDRIRSYLDSNCASCHKPGGASRGYFDARFETPLDSQGLISDRLMAGDMGVEDAGLVKPGEPKKSVLYLRMADKGGFRMPPGTTGPHDTPVLKLLEEWIRELDTGERN